MSDEKIYSNLQQIALKDEVYVDDNGMLGTQYPLGSYQFPVLTLAQARVISAERNIVSIRLRGSHNIDAAMERYNFKGYAHLDITDLVSFNGQDVDGSSFMDLVLTGAQGGNGYIYARDCVLINATSLRGVFNHTKLVTAIGLATGGGADNVDFVECYSLMGGVTVTVNSPDLVNFYGWIGDMTLATMTGGIVNIWASDGAVITINATCTAGTINIYGNCRVVDNSAGTVVNHSYLDFAVEENNDILSGMLVQVPFFVTMDTIQNNYITLFNFDALGATIKDIMVDIYVPIHATATFTPTWEKTLPGGVTYIVEVVPAIAAIATPGVVYHYRYHLGELAQGLEGRFRIHQSNHAGVVSIQAYAVVSMEI